MLQVKRKTMLDRGGLLLGVAALGVGLVWAVVMYGSELGIGADGSPAIGESALARHSSATAGGPSDEGEVPGVLAEGNRARVGSLTRRRRSDMRSVDFKRRHPDLDAAAMKARLSAKHP